MKENEDVFNIRLLQNIEKYDCLYNFTLAEYTSRDVTERAWNEIAEAVNRTPNECKYRWKNLRGSLTRNLNQKLKPLSGRTPKTFYLAKHMKFVIPFAKSRQGHNYKDALIAAAQTNPQLKEFDETPDQCAEEMSEDSWNTSDIKDVSTSYCDVNNSVCNFQQNPEEMIQEDPLLPKLEAATVLPSTVSASESDQYDADKHFLLSLLPHLSGLTPTEKLRFQIETLSVINDIISTREKVNETN